MSASIEGWALATVLDSGVGNVDTGGSDVVSSCPCCSGSVSLQVQDALGFISST